MTDFSGRKHAIGWGREATRGTAVAPTRWASWLDTDFGRKGDFIFNESVLGVLHKINDSALVKEYGEGKVQMKLGDRTIVDILLMALGAINTAANADASGNVYDHTITEGNLNQTPAYTLAVKNGNEDERYALATVKKVEIEIKVGAWSEVSVEFLSKKPDTASNTHSVLIENEFLAKHALVEMADDVAGLASPTTVPLRSLKLTIDRKVMDDQVFNSNDIDDIFSEEVEVSMEATLRYSDTTYRAQAFNDEQKALRITLVNDDVTIGTAANPGVVITTPKAKLTEWDRDIKAGDMVDQKLGITVHHDAEDAGYAIQAVVTNEVASYAAA